MSRKRQKHFRSLAPANDIQGVRSYIEWLDEIINDETFGSIAMTGDLGIGKSSVVRTFERTKRYKFIYLSASDLGYRFDENKPDAKAEDAKEKNARQARNAKIQTELEKDLLVQLIALCRRSDIPKSRFRLVPENGAPFLLKAYSFLCGAAALCGGMLAINMLTEQTVYPGTLSMWPWISLAVFASLSVWFWSNRLFQNYRLSKLSFGTDKTYSASAEINPNTLEPESLNTDLHEILYLFERLAKKKHLFKKRRAVFIIEDLDRYPSDICIPILTKLRQINSMLNSRYRNQHRGYGMHYKFVYLLNDRIFDASESSKTISEKDPYKFFDIMIPVLPKLGFTNSAKAITNRFWNYEIDYRLLSAIGEYVYDYRKLHDIENEFRVYYQRFKDIVPNTSLLAFVTYKVFFKEQYDQLYKKDEQTGEPQNCFLRSILNRDPSAHRSEGFQQKLENYFKDDMFAILQTDNTTLSTWIKAGNKMLDFVEINLSGLDLTGVNPIIFNRINLPRWIISPPAFLRRFIKAKSMAIVSPPSIDLLEQANLVGARLVQTNLCGAVLTDCPLSGAKLMKACLIQAKLNDADLTEADLTNANLTNADLTNADLTGAYLTGADLTGAVFEGAKYSLAPECKTAFPKGFDPQAHGMFEVDKDGIPVSHSKKKEKAAPPKPAADDPKTKKHK